MGMESTSRTMHGLLQAQVLRNPERTFFIFEDRQFSYADLDVASSRVAAGLQTLDLEAGAHVAVMMSNRPEFLFLDFGLSKMGAVEVPVNTAFIGELLRYLLRHSDSRAIVVEGPFLPALMEVVQDLPLLTDVIVLDGEPPSASFPGKRFHAYCPTLTEERPYQPVRLQGNDPFAILYTSGTTGPSKGAVLPHQYGLHMAEIISRTAAYDERDCLYNVLPLFHGNAKVLSTLPALMSGARMVLGRRFSASRFWADVRHYQCTEFNYIGSILAILMKADPAPGDADNPLRLMLGAGATPDLFEAFEARFGVKLLEGYGMSEIGIPLIAEMQRRKPGSCGRVHPDYSIQVVDDRGEPVGPHTPGELLVRPLKPCSMLLEYYRMPEKTVEAWQGLWFHTGDYLQYDEEGFFYFIDRKKDAIRRRGENISSFEVEGLVNAHPRVLESAAIPAPSELGEDEVMICVVPKAEGDLRPEELMRFCSERMPAFMRPRYIRILPALPKTPTEKVQKYRLREQGVTADTWDCERLGREEAS
jgi:crotonobetaine/carnitine-CoA ligase